MQDLPWAKAAGPRFIRFDRSHGAGLPSPGMVDQKLGIDPEQSVEQVFVFGIRGLTHRTPGDIPHGKKAVFLELLGITFANSPKVCQRSVWPQKAAVAHRIQLCNEHPIFIHWSMFGLNIHGYFGQVEVGADPGRRCDSCGP